MSIQVPVVNRNGVTNFMHRWALHTADLQQLLIELDSNTFLNNIHLLFSQPIENVVACICYPFDITKLSTDWDGQTPTAIKIGNVTMTQTAIDLRLFSTPFLDIGSFAFTPYFNSFLDHKPYTKIEMYLPYIGFVTLDNDLVMGHTISISYGVSLETGQFTAYLTDENGNVVFQQEGQIGIQIQIGGGANAQIARNMLMTTIGGVSSLAGAFASKNPAMSLVSSAVGIGTGTLDSFQYHLQKAGKSVPNTAIYGPQKAFVIITRPSIVVPTNYNHDVGRPSGKSAVLSTLTGYTEVEKVHVEGTGLGSVTKEEKEEIEKLLLSGVIF